MGKVDVTRMRSDRKKADKPNRNGVDILKFEEMEYLLYITPPVHDEDPVPYVEAQCHFQIGPNNRMVLNAEGLTGHKPFLDALGRRFVTGGNAEDGPFFSFADCQKGWELVSEYANKHRANKRIALRDRWYFGALVMATRRSNRDEWAWEAKPEFYALSVGKTIYNGITDVFFDVGDITDPDKAVLIKVARKGKGLDTEYAVGADVDTLREPMSISEDIWNALEPKLEPDQDGDLYKLVAQFCRTEEQAQAVLDGTDGSDDEDSEEGRSSRPTVTSTPAGRRRRKAEPEPDPFGDDASDEGPAEEEAPAPKRRRRVAAKEEVADDDGSSTAEAAEGEDIEELEKALKSRSRRRRKAASA